MKWIFLKICIGTVKITMLEVCIHSEHLDNQPISHYIKSIKSDTISLHEIFASHSLLLSIYLSILLFSSICLFIYIYNSWSNFARTHSTIYIYIYIYIYIVIHRRTVSLYHNSSAWLDMLESRSWDRNPASSNANPRFYHSATRKLAKEI